MTITNRGLIQEGYIGTIPANGNPGADAEVRLGLQGTALPGGDAGEQDAAGISSMYHKTDDGKIFKKVADAGSTADWEEISAVSITRWRTETVRASTNDTLSAGATDPTSWSDNDGGLDDTAFAIGEHVYADYDGTPALFKITAISTPNITLAAADTAIAAGDVFVIDNNLPDPVSAENEAIVLFNGSSSKKLGDVDWQALVTLSGVAEGSTNFGTWTAPVTLLFSATATAKALYQRIGDLLMQIRGTETAVVAATATTIDEVPMATVKMVKWLVKFHETATPANVRSFEITAINDGTNIDYKNPTNNLKLGSNIAYAVAVDDSAGSMRLRLTPTPAVTATVRRIEVVKTLL